MLSYRMKRRKKIIDEIASNEAHALSSATERTHVLQVQNIHIANAAPR